MGERPFEVVVYGATGFSGRQAVAYLTRRANLLGLRWAICGRDRGKLEALAASLPEPRPPVLIAAAGDAEALRDVCARTQIVISLVGPHEPLGDALLEQCVANQTHYADLCGENDVIAARVARLHQPARDARVKLIPACGYESVPFDLGALSLDYAFREADGSRLEQVDVEVSFVFHGNPLRMGHGISGGTLATGQRLIEAGDLTDPYRFVAGVDADPDLRALNTPSLAARRSPEGDWLAPLMPTPFLNPPTIHLTSVLLGDDPDGGYSPRLVYREAMNATASMGSPLLGAIGAKGFSSVMRRIAAIAAGRRTLADRVTLRALARLSPQAGKGPPIESLDAVDYRVQMKARSTSRLDAAASLLGRGHPGYRSSPNILAEAAIVLAREYTLPERFGVLTPASALGATFTACLAEAGLIGLELEAPQPREPATKT